MTKLISLFACLLAVPSLTSAADTSLRLPRDPASVEVPAVPSPVPDRQYMVKEYLDYYSALETYSELAYLSPQDSQTFIEASAAGKYLRERLELTGARINREAGISREALDRITAAHNKAAISWKVLSEISDLFGFNGPEERDSRGVPVKQGYCQINYVKNNVPFLVQYDGFLAKGEVILTFDDGPGPLTEEVSGAMRAAGADSIFFVLGSKMGPNGKELVKKTAADGHEIAVHGYHHATESGKPFTALSTEKIVEQLGGVAASIETASGQKPTLFRPPYGIITPEALAALHSEHGLIPVGWTIDTLDWSTKDPDVLFEKTISLIRQRGKGIVLMHDIHAQSRTASKRLVRWLAENGFKVVSPARLNEAYNGK
ncbi:MAG: polysaccharide deacetylase family protein [Elusimicrobiales bacterium]|nr:polysaccharide deacetylase family protein [Elusimicrobiales bacterium]